MLCTPPSLVRLSCGFFPISILCSSFLPSSRRRCCSVVQPKETNDIRDFLKKSRQKDAKCNTHTPPHRTTQHLRYAPSAPPAIRYTTIITADITSITSSSPALSTPRQHTLSRTSDVTSSSVHIVLTSLCWCGCCGCADVKIKKGSDLTKFKLRLSRYLYTLKVADQAKADKIAQSFPPGLKKDDIKGKSTTSKQ